MLRDVEKIAQRTRPSRRVRISERLGLFSVVAALWIALSVGAPGFLSHFNLDSLGRSLAVDMVVGFSQMVVLASGGLNLSVGAIGVCSVMTVGYLLQISGLPIFMAICGGLALGALLGWVNGFAIARLGVSSFVCTLGAANLFTGGMLILTKGQPFDKLPPEVNAFGLARVGGFLTLLLAALAVGLGLSVVYGFTSIGRQLLAAGANPRAASMSGVRIGRMIVLAHTLSGFLAGAAGGLVVAEIGAALPSAAGEEWLLPSFLAPALGGAVLTGGSLSVFGTIVGAALIATIRSGLLLMRVGSFWVQLLLGVALLCAVAIERYRTVRAEKRAVAQP